MGNKKFGWNVTFNNNKEYTNMTSVLEHKMMLPRY
jgi:hypothetical protein